MDNNELLAVLGGALVLGGLTSALWGLMLAGVFCAVGLALWAISKFEEHAGAVFFAGSAVALFVGWLMGTWGLFIALIAGIVVLVVGLKSK